MSKDIEKRRGKFVLKALIVAAISGAIWKIALRILAGNDSWEG